jgi:hypothetical protein
MLGEFAATIALSSTPPQNHSSPILSYVNEVAVPSRHLYPPVSPKTAKVSAKTAKPILWKSVPVNGTSCRSKQSGYVAFVPSHRYSVGFDDVVFGTGSGPKI